MEKNVQTLKYKDEADRAYGLAGMAVAVVVCNAEEVMGGVDLDAPDPSDMMELTERFYLAGERASSVAGAWQQILGAYRTSLMLASGNIMARYMVARHERVSAELRRALRAAVEPDGRDTCQLDDDEIDALFDRTYSYLERVFAHSGVGSITDDLAATLRRNRHMGHSEVIYALRALGRL